MKNGKYSNGKKSLNMKPLAVLLALTLLVGCAVGGTIAWLTAETEDVENTFTIGDINIDLTETSTTTSASGEIKKGYHFVPGDTLAKDPKVTVLANSEDCYLFIKVTSANNSCGDVASIVNWTIRDLETSATPDPTTKWVPYTPAAIETGVSYYYRTVSKDDADQVFYILTGGEVDTNGQVTISPEVTKEMVETINAAKPVLKFDAAAVQTANIVDEGTKSAVDVAFEQIQWN